MNASSRAAGAGHHSLAWPLLRRGVVVGKLGTDDRVAYLGMLQKVMPPERLPVACGWIRGGIGDAAWAALAARVPGLPA